MNKKFLKLNLNYQLIEGVNGKNIYNEYKDVSNKAMISLNGKSRKWSRHDYLKFGVTDGIKDYILLDKIYKAEGLPLTALIMMYGGGYANIPFKELRWRALTVKRGHLILKHIKEIETTFNIKHVRFSRFIWGFGKLLIQENMTTIE